MIRTVNLEKRYGRLVAVKSLNLHIAPGEFFGFLGPNGAGKTTTIKMLVGLLKPSAGSATIAGYDMQRAPQEAKRQVGFIPDRPFLYEKLSGREFLRFVADLHGLEERAARTRGEEFLASAVFRRDRPACDELLGERHRGAVRHSCRS